MSNKIVSIRCKVCGEYETTKLYASTNREANRKAEWMSQAGVYTCTACKAASRPKPYVSIRINRWDGDTYRVLAAGETYPIKDKLRKLNMRWGIHPPTPTSDADGTQGWARVCKSRADAEWLADRIRSIAASYDIDAYVRINDDMPADGDEITICPDALDAVL
jgi:hypothetical protein